MVVARTTTNWPSSDAALPYGFNTVRLRPSLRAAIRSERLHDAFATLFRKLPELDTESVEAIIAAAATDQEAAQGFVEGLGARPLRDLLPMQGPLLSVCHPLIPTSLVGTPRGTATDAEPLPGASERRISPGEVLKCRNGLRLVFQRSWVHPLVRSSRALLTVPQGEAISLSPSWKAAVGKASVH